MGKKVQEFYNRYEDVEIAGNNYITTREDAKLIKNIIQPKLKQKEPVNIFCSFSYFTSNYTGIFLMNELSRLMKKGCNVHLIMWDLNCESHPHFDKVLLKKGLTPAQLIEEKIQEINQIFNSFNTPMQKLKMYKASDVLNRFIKKQEPNLFLEFYKTMGRLNLNNLIHHHKASHLIQMPFDIFFANSLHQLYPERAQRIEAVLCYGYQERIFRPVLKAMSSHEITGNLQMPFLVIPPHPYLIYNGALPDWNMSRDAIVHHILSFDPSELEIKQLYKVILKKFLNKYVLLDKEKKVKELNYNEFMNKQEKAGIEEKQVSLAYNFYKYISGIKEKAKPKESSKVLHLQNRKETVKLAKILSRQRLVELLNAIDGRKNATQLAKEMQVARSNMSSYLNELKRNELIRIDENGRVHRKVSAITANFEVGIR